MPETCKYDRLDSIKISLNSAVIGGVEIMYKNIEKKQILTTKSTDGFDKLSVEIINTL